MPDLPFPIIRRRDAKRTIHLLEDYMRELYEERIAGARLGDVFSIPGSDIFTLNLLSTSGLYKITRALASRLSYPGQTLYLAVKPKEDGGIGVDEDGVYVDDWSKGYWKHFFHMGA